MIFSATTPYLEYSQKSKKDDNIKKDLLELEELMNKSVSYYETDT